MARIDKSLERGGKGSEKAPTERASERERVRHDLERRRGMKIAGIEGDRKSERPPGVTPDEIDDIEKEADSAVSHGQPVRHPDPESRH